MTDDEPTWTTTPSPVSLDPTQKARLVRDGVVDWKAVTRSSWEDLLGNPNVYLDGEVEAVGLLRRWVFGEPPEPVLPADQFIWWPESAERDT